MLWEGGCRQRNRRVSERRPLHSPWLVLQLAVDALEQEKQGLQSQIAQILEGGQQLAHLKMSLSLEVATYRYTDAHTALTPCLEGPGTWLCPFCEPQLLLYKNIYLCVFMYMQHWAGVLRGQKTTLGPLELELQGF